VLDSPLSDCGGSVNVLRSAAWPGGGVQITVGVGWASLVASPAPPSLAPRALPSVKLNGVTAVVTHAPQTAGLTGLLILLPGAQLDAVFLAVQALVESLPSQERVGVWYAASTGDAPTLVVDFTNRRAARRCCYCVRGAHLDAA
jgi:hypothetical protein